MHFNLCFKLLHSKTQVKRPGAAAEEDRGLEALAGTLAREALGCPPTPSAKPYVAALCKARVWLSPDSPW